MSSQVITTTAEPVILHMGQFLDKLSEQEFFAFCQLNREWRIERTSAGDLIIMPPTGGETGNRSFVLTGSFSVWVEADGTGVGFDSSTGFTLPNGAKRSPDLAWVKASRWQALTAEEREAFPPLCPDFVVELRSKSDPLAPLQKTMQEYIANGAQLGWLIDPQDKKVYVYRPNEAVICLDNPPTISGEPVLPKFVLDVQRVFS
ncbi:MAG: Uma2 family endonuclease [Acidobacteria bacterium]|nr:Uma2 family endonuclease [Acidobacteriota bacterium]